MLTDFTLGQILNIDAHDIFRQLTNNHTNFSSLSTLKYINILDKKFSAGTICVSNISETGVQFGILKNVFLIDSQVLINIEEYETIYFNTKYYAYSVNIETNKNLLIYIKDFFRFPPYQFMIKNNEEFIATRYDL